MSAEKTVKKKLSNVPLKIEDLIENYKRGLMAIPEFQRDYVWKPKKAPRLLDSMWNHYPIGAVLTWSTQDKVQSRIHFRVTSPTQWIIDGQQRTRTLVKISDGEIPVLFDIKNERFLLENAATKKAMDPTLIPISEIWGAQLIEVTRKFEGIAKNAKEEREFSERLDACRRLLLMEIPQVHLEGHTIEEAIAAFQRINTQGMKLKSSDITIAQLTVKHSGFVKNSVQPFIDELKRKGWDRVYVSQLFVACEGIAEKGARGEARKRLQELSTKELK